MDELNYGEVRIKKPEKQASELECNHFSHSKMATSIFVVRSDKDAVLLCLRVFPSCPPPDPRNAAATKQLSAFSSNEKDDIGSEPSAGYCGRFRVIF